MSEALTIPDHNDEADLVQFAGEATRHFEKNAGELGFVIALITSFEDVHPDDYDQRYVDAPDFIIKAKQLSKDADAQLLVALWYGFTYVEDFLTHLIASSAGPTTSHPWEEVEPV